MLQSDTSGDPTACANLAVNAASYSVITHCLLPSQELLEQVLGYCSARELGALEVRWQAGYALMLAPWQLTIAGC